MAEIAIFEAGGYRYIRGPFQYSGGVAAQPSHAIERVRFRERPAINDGFQAIEAYLTGLGRPLTAFCACELRSPAPFTEEGFIAFNRVYVGTLERWSIFKDDDNPVARSNVCPEIDPPAEPVFHAFSYTVPAAEAGGAINFVNAGSADARESAAAGESRVIRPGDTTADGMRAKARHVLDTQEERLAAFGAGWADATATQVYSVHDIHAVLENDIQTRGAAPAGLTWFHARPPVEGLDYEMDVRAVEVERVLG